jgi:hypothetical protein
VITIDDLQWADADSFLLLRELFRGAGAPPVLVLATVRGDDPAADALAAALEGVTVERTRVGPLSDDEAHALAERLIPGARARFDLDRVAREAGGHPMFLHEILRHLDGAGGGDAGATLDDALSGRVALLRPEARTLLEVVCLAGAPISLETAALACRLDATTIARSVASLRVATLVRETQRDRQLALEPYHDRVREAVGGRVDAAHRRDLHARIAYALEASHEPRDPQLLLRNFLLAELPERAVRYAEEAAQRSEAAHAFDQAAELWRTALDAIPREPADRRRVLLRLGDALINAGRGADAAQHFLAAAEGADRPTRLECHRQAAEQLILSGRIAPGLAALEALLAEIGVKTHKTPRRTLASLLYHRALIRLRGLGFRERHRREIADATMLELDVLRIAASSLALVDSIRGMDFQTRHLLMALRTGHRAHVVRALLVEAMYHATGANARRAQRYIDRALEVGGDPDEPYARALLAAARGSIAYFGGDPVAAAAYCAETVGHLRQVPGNTWENGTGRLFELFALRFIGDYVALRARYQAYADDAAARGDRYLDSTMRRACVTLWLAEDDVAGAERDLERATWVPPADQFHVQHFHELMAWGELALYRGELRDRARLDDAVAKLHASLLLRVETIRVQYESLRGRLAIAGHLPAREAARAARALAREANPMAKLWAIAIQAGAIAADDRARAASLFERAAADADRNGMRATAAAARVRVAELRGEDPAPARVELAALGVRDPDRMCALLVPVRASRRLSDSRSS